MTGTRLARYFLLAVLPLFVACADDENKIGTTVKGTRVAAIEEVKALEPDPALKDVKPALPEKTNPSSWTQVGFDASHAVPHADVSMHPKILWKESIGAGSDSDFKLLAHPVIDRGVIYTMDAHGVVRAFAAASGDEKWRVETTPPKVDDDAIAGGLAVDGTALYVTTGFGDVLALDTQKGAVLWRRALLKPLRAAPVFADHRVYVISIDNDLNALDARTGDVLWHQSGIAESATLMGASSPAVDGDTMIAAYNSGEVFALRAQNGRALWNYSLAAPAQVGALPAIADIRGLPIVDHGYVYAISHSGRIASIEQRSGERVWETDIGGIDTPVVSGDAVFLYSGDNRLIALSRDKGRALWAQALPKLVDPMDKNSDRIVWTGPVLAGDRLWMVNSQGSLASFSPENGAPLDSIDIGKPIYLTPIVADHTLYVVSDDGTLIALR